MSTFTWGKILFSKRPEILKDHVFEDTPVYFSNEKNALFISDLRENEKYFNLALGQERLIDLSESRGYINDDANYFYKGLSKKNFQ